MRRRDNDQLALRLEPPTARQMSVAPVSMSPVGRIQTATTSQERRPTASILHADLDSFYASVEQRDDPALRGRPVIVGGGVVLAASYEAKARGVRTPMNGRLARQLCPEAVEVSPRFEAYSQASKEVFAIFRDTTPLVEGISIDEAFLDVGGLLRISGAPVVIARTLRRRVRDEVGLPISIGIATTKFLAKVASAVSKPDGLLEVPAGDELAFLHPLPIERLWGVGAVTSQKLRDRGIATVGQLAHADPGFLTTVLGSGAGHHLYALAWARDPRRVDTGRRRRSIGSQRALGRGRRTPEELETMLNGIVDRITRRLRTADRLTRTVILRLRFDDFSRATRSHTLGRPTDRTEQIRNAAQTLLADAMPLIREKGVTLIGLSMSNLDDDEGLQSELPFDEEPRGPRVDHTLDQTLDGLRERFGTAAVTRAALLGHQDDRSVPLLPD